MESREIDQSSKRTHAKPLPDGRSETVTATTHLPKFPAGEVGTTETVGLVTDRLNATVDNIRAVHDKVDEEDPTSADLMIRAAGRLVRKHRLLFVVLKDEELEAEERRRPESPADIIRSNVAAAMLRDRALVIARMQRLGIEVLEVPHDGLGAAVVDAYLGMKRRGAI